MSNEMTALTNFSYENVGVRVLGTKLEPWFVCRDVFDILEIPLNYMARTLKRLDGDEKGAIKLMTPGGEQEVWVISEPGLYKIMLRSRTPKAEAFTRFVTHEVLPSIRRYGYYKAPKPKKPEALPGRRGRPALGALEVLERQKKYTLANGEKCSYDDALFYGNMLEAPKEYTDKRRVPELLKYINDEMSNRGIDCVARIRPKFCPELYEDDETYFVEADGKLIELVR